MEAASRILVTLLLVLSVVRAEGEFIFTVIELIEHVGLFLKVEAKKIPSL